MNIIVLYLIVINLISAVLFVYDKSAATRNKRRTPENLLHFFEFIGGVFAIIVLMYAINHKRRKLSYYLFTWILLIWWVAAYFLVISKLQLHYLFAL